MTAIRSACAALILLTPLLLQAGEPVSIPDLTASAATDLLWGQIEQLVDEHRKAAGNPLPEAKIYRLRELALEFYENHPSDPRSTALRRALLSYKYADPFDPFRSAVAIIKIQKTRDAEDFWNLDARTRELVELATAAGPNPEGENAVRISRLSNSLHALIRSMHPSVVEERAIYTRLKAAPNADLHEWIAGRERFLELREKPLDLKLPTIGGKVVDLEELRGKVVLLDVWTLHCSVCIANMPRMQALYEKYRDRNFEIVGVLMSESEPKEQNEEKRRASEILDRKGATWPDAIMTDSEDSRIAVCFLL